jgi:hypothetical protein
LLLANIKGAFKKEDAANGFQAERAAEDRTAKLIANKKVSFEVSFGTDLIVLSGK